MLEWVTEIMNSMGYFAIVFLMFLENVFPPIPSELIMPLAGFTATQGKLTLVGVILAGTLGSVLGALPLYYIGKIVGAERLKNWADKYGKWLTVSREDIEKSQFWFEKHGNAAIFFGRLVPGVRSLISVPAGIANMNLPLFLLYSSVGAGIWSSLLGYGGYLLGENYQKVEKIISPVSYAVIALVIAVYIFRLIKQHRAETQPG